MVHSLIDSQILSTLELLHYCRRFEHNLFAFLFQDHRHCESIVMDLRVLQAARIQQVVFCPDDDILVSTLETWNRSGDRFLVMEVAASAISSQDFAQTLRAELAQGSAPFVALQDMPEGLAERQVLEAQIIRLVRQLNCKKVFFLNDEAGLHIDGVFQSYPPLEKVREALRRGAIFNLPSERVQFFVEQQELHGVDLALVKARRGAVFEEVFTHAGSGTLFTQEYPNILRPATESDVRDIMAMMHPYITEGSLKAMTEEELLAMIRSFMVYSVNGQIVCAAALRSFGNSCEIAKLCTLPRYQARGRARALVLALAEEARKLGKSSVFALTVEAYVGQFFERLGFTFVDRSELPDEWQQGYDFGRPSKAYRLSL